MSTFKRGDIVVLKFSIEREATRKRFLVENNMYLDSKVDVIYYDVQERIHRDRFHVDLLELAGE
jgi:hypothetical protein|nr:MAG TPA: putative small protein [Caudoviricetes sp.]